MVALLHRQSSSVKCRPLVVAVPQIRQTIIARHFTLFLSQLINSIIPAFCSTLFGTRSRRRQRPSVVACARHLLLHYVLTWTMAVTSAAHFMHPLPASLIPFHYPCSFFLSSTFFFIFFLIFFFFFFCHSVASVLVLAC